MPRRKDERGKGVLFGTRLGELRKYGETQSAMSDYQSVTKPKKPMQIPSSPYKLAQMRLAVINGHAATSAK